MFVKFYILAGVCLGNFVFIFFFVLWYIFLQRMKHLAGNKTLQHDFQAAKSANKAKLAALIKSRCGVEVSKQCEIFEIVSKRVASIVKVYAFGWLNRSRGNRICWSVKRNLLLLFQVSEKALFDVQIKRIHEYKRQLLNILSLIYRYQCIKVMVTALFVEYI